LFDTSLSMGMAGDQGPGLTSRAQQVVSALDQTSFLDDVRATHDLFALTFAEQLRRVASLRKRQKSQDAHQSQAIEPGGGSSDETADEPLDWQEALRPEGTETRLGQALRQVVSEERAAPVSAVVLFSDGQQNSGVGMHSAIDAAQEARIKVYTVGVGADRLPANVRVYKIAVVPRAYPGDPLAVKGLVQGSQLAGQSVTVELLIRDAESDAPGSGRLLDTREILLGADGETVPVEFELTPTETGRKTLCLRARPHPQDGNPTDDLRETEVEIADRKDRVLLFAGGPTREYRFLRTLFYRDTSVLVDVFLQTAQPGISQDADDVLDDLPLIREEMYAYDCIVAIDPDWNQLTDAQIDLLTSWVGEQSGGLIVIAGPVHAGQAILGWAESERMRKVRDLYPVDLPRNIPLMATDEGRRDPRRLDFSREGLAAGYLWLGETETASQEAWAGFPGVYRCYRAWRAKPAATVLARFTDPRVGRAEEQSVFFAEQFYGAGRVFYIGSGELWRLRALDESYFEKVYTGLLRHVTQGRLLRQSTRGTLIVGREEGVLGSTIPIRAQLTDARLRPLDVSRVSIEVIRPDASVEAISLLPDSDRIGTYSGQLTVLQEGAYRVELPVPNSNERLTRRIQVTLPDRERENPKRNDELLARIARECGGEYYRDLLEAMDPESPNALVRKLKDRTEEIRITAAPDPLWEENWLKWLMVILCTLLCVEWLFRRLLKLA
jgi:hypothetical protein